METRDKKKLPRYKRLTGEKPTLLLQPRDIEIIRAVYDYRFLNSELIRALFKGSERRILLRLQKLFHNGYLDRIKGSVNTPIIYALGDEGADLISEIYGLERGQIKWRKKNKEVKDYYLNHTLQVSGFRAILNLALKDKPESQITTWIPEGEISDRVIIEKNYHRKFEASVNPDSFFVLKDRGELLPFFLEADRSTMTTERFFNKMRAYWVYWREEHHKKKLNIKGFRVLTITKSQERKENLRTITKEADDDKTGSPMYWFACEENYNLKKPETILKPIWQTPVDNHYYHLLE